MSGNYEFRSSDQICEIIIKECFNEDDKVSINLILSSIAKIIEWLNQYYGFLNRENKIKLIIQATKMLSQKASDIEEFYKIDVFLNEKLENYLLNILELEDDKSKKENLNYDLEYNYYFISKHKNLFFMIIISFLIFIMASYTALSLI